MAVYQRTRKDALGRLVRGKWVAERTVDGRRQRAEFNDRKQAAAQVQRWKRGEGDFPPPSATAPPPGVPPLVDMIPIAATSLYRDKTPIYAKSQEGYMRKFAAWAEAETGTPVSAEWPDSTALARFRDHVAATRPKTSGRQRMSASAVNDHMVAVRNLLKFAHSRGLRKAEAPKVERVKVKDGHPSYLEQADEDALVKELTRRGQSLEADFVRASCMSGLRLNELLKLRASDVKPTHIILHKQKSGKAGALAIIPEVHRILLRRLPWVIHEKTLRRHIYAAVAALGWRTSGVERLEKFRLHSLRHTTGTRLHQRGVDVLKIKAVLRHSSIEQTMRYTHLVPAEAQQQAVSVLSRELPEEEARGEDTRAA